MPQIVELPASGSPPSPRPPLAAPEQSNLVGAIENLTPDLLRARYAAKLARMRALSAATLPPLPLDDLGAEDAD